MPRKPKNPNRGLRWGGGSVRPRGATWEARWWAGDVHRSKSFATADAAWDHLIDIQRGRAPANPSNLTVKDLVEMMLDHADGRLADSTIYTYRYHANHTIYPSLGARRAVDLTPYDIQQWIDQLKPQYQPATRRLLLAILSSAYSEARRIQIVPANPVSGVRRPAMRRSPVTVWSIEEARIVLEAIADDPIYGALYLVALVTGMRPSELAALRWTHVDLERGTLLVCATLAHDKEGTLVLRQGTKGKEDRTIAIAPLVCQRLDQHRARQQQRQRACPAWHDNGLVFDRGNGQWVEATAWRQFHARLCHRLGVPVITLHGLRHTSATFELDANTHGKIVADRLGHKDPSFTMRFYQHVRPPIQDGAAQALSNLILGASPASFSARHRLLPAERRPPRSRPAPRTSRR